MIVELMWPRILPIFVQTIKIKFEAQFEIREINPIDSDV